MLVSTSTKANIDGGTGNILLTSLNYSIAIITVNGAWCFFNLSQWVCYESHSCSHVLNSIQFNSFITHFNGQGQWTGVQKISEIRNMRANETIKTAQSKVCIRIKLARKREEDWNENKLSQRKWGYDEQLQFVMMSSCSLLTVGILKLLCWMYF